MPSRARAHGHGACRWRCAILTLPHVVGRQVIEVEVASDAGTTDLLDRIGEINHVRFLPVIARVLAEFDRPGVVIRIDRIDLRLGTVSVERLDTLVERLEMTLREALADALAAGTMWPANSGRAGMADTISTETVPLGAALLRSLTHYLLSGTWPYRTRPVSDPAALLADLIEREPAALLQIIRRHRERPALVLSLIHI